jgi:hypothetical protein
LKVIFIVITLSVFSGLIGTHISSAQDKDLMDMEMSLFSDYKNMITADYWNRFDFLAPAFKEKLKTILSDRRTYEFPFDTLKKYITIVTSVDRKLRIFSWDERTGGSAHQMTGIAQFTPATRDEDIQIADLENDDEEGQIDDVIYYEIHDIQADSYTYYITFGWGTFGGGTHFRMIRSFKIAGNNLDFNDRIFKYKGKPCNEIILLAPRVDTIYLRYITGRQTIEFDELCIPASDKAIGHYIARPTGRKVRLKFDGKRFKAFKP